jgi:predicted PurR-regulated permease PerM
MSENTISVETKSSASSKTSEVLKIGRNIVQERLYFFLLLAILLLLALLLIWPNLIAILTAIALVVLIKPLYNLFLGKKRIAGSPMRATAVTLISFVLLIAVPVILFMWIAYNQANDLLANSLSEDTFTTEALTAGVSSFLDALAEEDSGSFNLEELRSSFQQAAASFTNWLTDILTGLVAWLVQFFATAVIVLVIMMVMLPRYKTPEQDQMASLIPFPHDITNLYLEKIQLMVMAMFKGTFLIAILQGAAMGVVFLIAGVPYVFLLTLLCMFLALLPMIGISLIAWPVGIILLLNGDIWQGIFVIVMFLVVVANIDTVLRPVLVPKAAYLNPALLMLSVFGGLALLGFIGLIYGPVIMILLVTSLEVYTKYIMRSDLEPFLAEDGSLDMEKLGLRDAVEENQSGAVNVMHRVANFISRRESKEDDEKKDDKTDATE